MSHTLHPVHGSDGALLGWIKPIMIQTPSAARDAWDVFYPWDGRPVRQGTYLTYDDAVAALGR